MNKTYSASVSFFENFLPLLKQSVFSTGIGFAVPFTSLELVGRLCTAHGLLSGAQNVYQDDAGAFTGEISAAMVKDLGAGFVIVGHSERRLLFQETDAVVALKMRKILDYGLLPVFCIGETGEQREQGLTRKILKEQLVVGLKGVGPNEEFIVAYEPVWSIGTGKIPEIQEIKDTHLFIREVLAEIMIPGTSDRTSILYGGSVNGKNVSVISSLEDVDGVLVGGASLDPISFFEIVSNYSSV